MIGPAEIEDLLADYAEACHAAGVERYEPTWPIASAEHLFGRISSIAAADTARHEPDRRAR